MDKKKQQIALIICVGLFAVCSLLSLLFSKKGTTEWADASGSSVVISEILPSNRTYPTQDGQHLDFIELHNLSSNAVDISGFMLSDDLSSIGYTFPSGTVLPPYGYTVCWCDPESQEPGFANFRISREGGETIYLYNSANVVIDQKDVPPTAPNTPLIRLDQSTWQEATHATPGFPNTEEGYQAWLLNAPGGDSMVTITEVLSDNSCVTAAPGASPCDWVELTNQGTSAVVLTGAYLSNDPADPLKWQIGELTLAPGASTIIYCAGSQATGDEAPFGLSKTGCTVILTSQLGNTLSQISCPTLPTDHSWAQDDTGNYQITDCPTPGFPNSDAGYAAWLSAVGEKQTSIVISEVMPNNRSTLLSSAGVLCDWVELTNTGSVPVSLNGCYLSDDPEERGKWAIGNITLAAGESVVIPCVGAMAGEGEATFALSSDGCTLILSGNAGNIISKTQCPVLDADRVWALQADGAYLMTDTPSPGYPNTEEGYLAYRSTQLPLGELAITEVMSSNSQYLIQSDGRYYDWVELTNVAGHTIDLSDYYLSNDPKQLTAFQLPQRKLAPGERVVIICSANDTLVGKYIQAPFTLSAQECWVYVTESSGELSDYLRIANIPDGCSAGRTDADGSACYFQQPTPARTNPTGFTAISQMPTALTAPGIYNNVASVTVELSGVGTLHYTTDGSEPTVNDPVYTSPFVLTTSTTLRVAGFEEGKLKSKTLTASYIINENHTLPVVSLVADPNALFGVNGIYSKNLPSDNEIACNISLFEENGSFSLDCGLEMMATTPAYQGKRSMQVHFRGQYGSSILGYPVFGAEGSEIFDALCLVANSEQSQTLLRDQLFTQLCEDFSDSVPFQHSKFCVLYINGQYYGIYALKEDVGQTLYSQQMAVSATDVTVVEEPSLWGSELYLLSQFCKENDMADQSAFDQFASRLDTENLIDWMILQGYICNESIANNLTYFRSPETGNRWQLGFFDLKNGLTDRTGFQGVLTTEQPYQYLSLTQAIISNPSARQAFLERFSEALNTTLSNEHVLSLIDRFEVQLSAEIQRERDRWGGSVAGWQADVNRLRAYLIRYDHKAMLLETLRETMNLTDAEMAALRG